jgi:hypothetical protein
MMQLQFKEGVQLTITQAVNKLLQAGVLAFSAVGKPCVVTSGRDGQHQVNSKHYTNEALDFRTFHLQGNELSTVVQTLKDTLGQDFDVVIEATHIHLEYDPKGVKKNA